MEVRNTAPTQQQQRWLNPKLGAECILASSDHASICRKCSVRLHTSPSLMQRFTCGPFWLMGRDKATGLEVMPFREGMGRNYPVSVCSVYRCTDKNRRWTPRKGTHCSLAKVASVQPEGSQAQSLSRGLKDTTGLARNHKSQVLAIYPSWWRPSLEESKSDCLLSSSNIKAPREITLKHNDHEDDHNTVP